MYVNIFFIYLIFAQKSVLFLFQSAQNIREIIRITLKKMILYPHKKQRNGF